MHTLESLAYASPLRFTNPWAKFWVALGSLLLCVGFRDIVFSIIIISVMSLSCVQNAKVPFKTYGRICRIPLLFIVLSSFMLLFDYAATPAGYYSLGFLDGYLNFTIPALRLAFGVSLAAFGAYTCLCYLCVSTPMAQIMALLQQLRIPAVITELLVLTYRFIYILLEEGTQLRTAQLCRLGKANFWQRGKAALGLFSTVFVNGITKTEAMLHAMQARGYDGSIAVQAWPIPMAKRQIISLCLYFALLLAAGIFFSRLW